MAVARVSVLVISLVERGETLGLEAGAGRVALPSLVGLVSFADSGADVLLELLAGLRQGCQVVLNSRLQEAVIHQARRSRGVKLEVHVEDVLRVVELCRIHLVLLLHRLVPPATPPGGACLIPLGILLGLL